MNTTFFCAGNTTAGFINYFDKILDGVAVNKLFCIKGGSGVGKSTLMKKIAREAEIRGFDVWLMPCSSDYNSLDGVAIPALGVALVDGTAPHVIDPTYPAVHGETVNLGDFLNVSKLLPNKEEIVALIDAKKICYQNVFSFLKSSGAILSSVENIESKYINRDEVAEIANNIYKRYLEAQPNNYKDMDAFSDYLDENGVIDIFPSIIRGRKLVALTGTNTSVGHEIMQRLFFKLKGENKGMVRYHSVMYPSALSAIAVGNVVVAINPELKGDYTVDVDSAFTVIEEAEWKKDIILSRNSALLMTANACNWLTRAKRLHAKIESYYVAAMDFESAKILKQKIIDKVFSSD